MLMYYETVDENQGAQRGLKHLAYKYTDMGGYEDERDQAIEQYLKNDYDRWYSTEMEKYEKGERSRKPSKTQYTAPTNQVDGGKVDFEWLPMETIYKYASADTDVTLQLYHIFDKKVKSRPKWIKFCYEFFPQLCDTLAYMQHTGFQMDMDKMEKYREHFTNDIEEVTIKYNGDQVITLDSYLDIGLYDTMKDLLVNFIGAIVFSIFGYIYIKNRDKKVFVTNFIIYS